MHIDKKTLEDLSIFHRSGGVWSLLDKCITSGGSAWLKHHVCFPPADFNQLITIQDTVRYLSVHITLWPQQINNGTMLMVEKFFTSTDAVIQKPTTLSLLMYRIARALVPHNEQSLLRFSITQVMEFVQGCHQLVELHKSQEDVPQYFRDLLIQMEELLSGEIISQLVTTPTSASYKELLTLSYYTRRHLKQSITKLTHLFHQVDGLRAMAQVGMELGWTFPELLPEEDTTLVLEDFYHPLLEKPVSYSIAFSQDKNFMFLTGANMSGKSTLIRSIGICAWLGHIGMSVPAKRARISFLNSIVTNMGIEDNIYKGESYFYAEVKRIKNTVEGILAHRHNLVLMDELFKGTNIHDAYECTEAVINGLVKNRTNIMALSTHLYEIADKFQYTPNIQFTYCETIVSSTGAFQFTYKLREGVSNDRIGYLVLKREGVLDILHRVEHNINDGRQRGL